MLYAITTLLEDPTWHEILQKIPDGNLLVSSGKIEHQYPHFSWIVSQGLEVEKVFHALDQIAKEAQSFITLSGGTGIFPGEEPAVTLILVRNRMMDKLHKKIWTACARHAMEMKQTYTPEAWIPHVTLLHYGNQKEDYSRFLEGTLYKEIHIQIKVNNLALIFRDGEKSGQLGRFDF